MIVEGEESGKGTGGSALKGEEEMEVDTAVRGRHCNVAGFLKKKFCPLLQTGRKRALDSDGEESGEGEQTNREQTHGGGGIYRTGAQRLDFREHGAEYKAKVRR